jgi:hypothetical protein
VAIVLGLAFAGHQLYPSIVPHSLPPEAGIHNTHSGVGISGEGEATGVGSLDLSLPRSVPTTWQWRERVRAVVQKTAAAKDYRLYNALYDKEDYPDPDAKTIFLFKSATSPGSAPHGLLILTPEDYADLSMLHETELEAEIVHRLFSQWAGEHGRDAQSMETFAKHVLNIASVLYAQPRIEEKFPVAINFSPGVVPFSVECGDLHLSLDSIMIDRLLEQPAMKRDLHLAEMIEKRAPDISAYLRGPAHS